MSATLPPTADRERPSDFAELWPHAAAPRTASVMPEADGELPALPLSPEQHARRLRLRRAVGGVVLGLLAFTAVATSIYVIKGRAAANSSAENEQLVAGAASEPALAVAAKGLAATPAPAREAIPSTAPVSLSEADQASALVHAPLATVENLQAWSRLASQLSAVDRHHLEHDLSRLSVGGMRPTQEAARLELALLWRATARRAKAQKVLVSLARTASDPVVKKYALETLSAV